MLRSHDGITWEQLPDTAFPQGHSIFRITYGYGDPSDVCPLASSRN